MTLLYRFTLRDGINSECHQYLQTKVSHDLTELPLEFKELINTLNPLPVYQY
jgi:hypothetical protein